MYIGKTFWLTQYEEKVQTTFPACVQAYGDFVNRWSLSLLGDGPDIDYDENGVGCNICTHTQMARPTVHKLSQ